MANTTITKGWWHDIANSRLVAMFNDTQIFRLTANTMTVPSGTTFTAASGSTVNLASSTVTLPTRTAFIDLEECLKGADGADLALSETADDFFRDAASSKWNINGEATVNETELSTGLFTFVLPENYVAGGSITLRAKALVTVAGDAVLNVASTIDMTAKKVTFTTGAVGSDLVTTAATALPAAGATYDFVVTPTGLVAGDKLSCSVATSIVEDAAGTGAANSVITLLGAVVQVNL